jgi:hypothetical protein
MGIFDGLPNPAAPALAFQQGMLHGRQEREEREVRGALSAYAVNPDDDTAFQKLAQWRPELAIQIGEDRRKRQQAAQVAELTRRAAAGDTNALQELAPIDMEAWAKLDTRQRAHIKEGVDYVGQAAIAIARLPAEQQAAAWDEAAQRGVEMGFTELQDEIGNFDPGDLDAAIRNAGLVKQYIEMNEPRYQAIPEGGTLVDTSNPQAVQSFVSGAGRPVAGPQPGAEVNGYRFKGGDPNDRNSWEKAGGGVSNGTGTFRP